MDNKDLDLILDNLRNIVLTKDIKTSEKSQNETLELINQAIEYLSVSLKEADCYSRSIAKGDLERCLPSRHNMLCGGLKEIHSVLKHLTWQTVQVADGNYNQQVHFLGDFSIAFNKMIKQLEDREEELRQNAKTLSESMELLKSIMKVNKDWIIVIEKENGKVIYTNESYDKEYEKFKSMTNMKAPIPPIISLLTSERDEIVEDCQYQSCINFRHYLINSYFMTWNGVESTVYYICDNTEKVKQLSDLQKIAFTDQLSGVFNRRYCMDKLSDLIKYKKIFSMVMVDLNDLKIVNDKLGHVYGDEYIKTVVAIIKEKTRERDIISRIGGDEFMIILPDCTEEMAVERMEKVVNDILNCEKEYKMSVSYGAVFVDDNNALTLNELLNKSDIKMYEHKKNIKGIK